MSASNVLFDVAFDFGPITAATYRTEKSGLFSAFISLMLREIAPIFVTAIALFADEHYRYPYNKHSCAEQFNSDRRKCINERVNEQ